ncbi:hypothetical protein D8B26_003643 [Coccidioides posadasii str. Silveira]|uniref:uncharacterized protein n=1 Tax=Coccidioides posadasii (strain RMSCC 757 / Silveira) TaxID=443226 RepID=UPI001BF12D04|nr:hypothetical protein D8B26_003643 [Coccidioides posadasii str. Silveira]
MTASGGSLTNKEILIQDLRCQDEKQNSQYKVNEGDVGHLTFFLLTILIAHFYGHPSDFLNNLSSFLACAESKCATKDFLFSGNRIPVIHGIQHVEIYTILPRYKGRSSNKG